MKEMNEAYFSPGDECLNAIVNNINKAISSLRICVFTISDDRITRAILERRAFGVDIRIITDNDKCYDLGSDIELLCKKGVDIKVDKTSYHMHHKFAIIDNAILLTGSYNWTRSAATSNHENLVVLTDKEVLRSFRNEFDKLWSEMIDSNF